MKPDRIQHDTHGNKLGQQFHSILEDIHDALWDFEADNNGVRMGWTDDDLKYATKIFATIILDRAYEIDMTPAKAQLLGKEIRELVKSYTHIDMWEKYKEEL